MAARRLPDFLGRAAWSPDGKAIAYGTGSYRGGLATGLAVVPVEGGAGKQIIAHIGYNPGALRWLPDGHGLIASTNAQFPLFQVWYISYPGGQPRSITSDLNNYRGLSLTADAGALVTVQTETTSHIWATAPDDPGSAREISTGRLDGLNAIAWAGNGNLYFEAPDNTQDTQIWRMAADGTGRKQITAGHLTGLPVVCGDDRYLVFHSYRVGAPHIWRSDLDGGNLRQLTNGEGEVMPSCSPDGSWLTYASWLTPDPKSRGIWRMSIDGGASARIWDFFPFASSAFVSPDGKSVLVPSESGAKIHIIPAAGGEPIRSFDRASELGVWVHWSVDGAALLYVKTAAGVSNIWTRPLNGGGPKQLTAFTSQRITTFAVSRDGKRLALARGSTSSDVVLIRDLN